MLTLKSDGKRIVEKDTSRTDSADSDASDGTEKSSSQSSVQESTVFEKDASGSEQPFVSEELEPEIAGVLVIAQGAADAEKCAEITEAVMALFDVPAHKIKVMKME
jgi:stage III sporulation protein AG